MFAHFAKVGAEPYTGEGEEESPAGEVGEGEVLVLGEKVVGGKNGDEKEAEDELGEFLPEESGFVADGFGLALAGPIDGVGENDETDHGVARGFGEDGEFAGGVGIESAGGGGFGGVVHGEAGPETVGLVREMEGMAEEGKGEEGEGAESENGGDGERGVFVIGVNGAFGGDNGADTADGGADGEERGELGAKMEEAAEKGHEGEGAEDFDGDEEKADAAELEDVAEEEARAQEDDACFEPEFVSGHAGLEDFGDADGVGDEQAEENGPEDVFDVGEDPVVGFGVGADVLFEEFAGVANGGEKKDAGD